MSDQQNRSTDQRGNSCMLPIMFTVAILLALLLGGAGGAMLDDPGFPRQTTIYPVVTVAPETLHIVPSVQTFADTPLFDPCTDPTAPLSGWENGVGGTLPPCWAQWTREQQNAFLRSH